MGCCQNTATNLFSLISDDSLVRCFSFLDPFDFIHIRRTCKDFNTLTDASTKSIQGYWKHQCIFICDDVLDAIQCNNSDTENWFDFYFELQELLVYLTRHVYQQDMDRVHGQVSKTFQNSTLYYLYNNNYRNGKKLFPMKLIKLNDSEKNQILTHRYLTIRFVF